MKTNCPYLTDIDKDLRDRGIWNSKDTAILKRMRGDRPARRNHPYPNSPNPLVNLIDDGVRDKTDQEISMILNAPVIALFIPLEDSDPEVVSKAQSGFNTYLRHLCDYRVRKEEAVSTKNARGFAITKVIHEEHVDWGKIPSFETIDPKDLIVPVETKDLQKSERVTHVLRLSRRELKAAQKERGWSGASIRRILESLKGSLASNNDDTDTFKVVAPIIGLNKSDLVSDKIVIWEVCHYATDWDVENSNGIISNGDKCISWVSPDAPMQLLHIVAWRDPDFFDAVDITDPLTIGIRKMEGLPLFETKEIKGNEKRWPYVQHRYEIRDRLWYSSRGIGHLNMDNQIAATAIERAKLIHLDYVMNPLFKGGDLANQQNVTIKPGAVLPGNVEPVKVDTGILQSLNFEIDNQRRDASRRAAAGDSMYSANISTSRKLEKTATEVQSENAKQGLVSSASVDRFNDPDRELFRQLWAELRKARVQLPIIEGGEFGGFVTDEIYGTEFLIVPAASQRTLNPDAQFMKSRSILEMLAPFAADGSIDMVAGAQYIVEMADPSFSHILFKERRPDSMVDGVLDEHENEIAKMRQLTQGGELGNVV